ncbi:hypothetical protein JTB14_007005 [Gonioctena quinquepunctata]|nr:hypothetical protein JTB14_007005 [Gonioctena quinquepunctata]
MMEIETKPNIDHLEASTSSEVSIKLGLCEVCAYRNAKYTCPRCEVKTCSLKCNKIHKLEIECDGQRDRTKFVPLNKFSNLDLSSDYRLLEEITRSIESSRKNFDGHKNNEILPPSLFRLKEAATTRRVNLKFLPFKFARRKNNTTCLFKNIIYWRIEWIFVDADKLKVFDAQVCETEKLSAIMSKYLDREDEFLSEKLQYYRSVGLPGVQMLLKAEQKGVNKFYELDPTVPLKENLEKKLIIEHPTINVVLKDRECGYHVIDSDDEENMEIDGKVKSGNEIVDSIISHAKSDESLYKSLKNLLFTSDYSDEEVISE